MKKTMAVLMALITALSLSGCANGSDPGVSGTSGGIVSDPNTSADGNTPGNTSNTPASGNDPGGDPNAPVNSGDPGVPMSQENKPGALRQLLDSEGYFNHDKTAKCTKDGYYNIRAIGGERRDGLNLTYIDFASRREVVVCSDSSCKHNNENCTSYFSRKEFFSMSVFVCNDHLYVLSSDRDQDGSFAAGEPYYAEGYEPKPETRRAAIYRMNLDGTGREKIWQAELGDIIEHGIFTDGENLWFVAKTPTAEIYEKTGAVHYHSKNRALMKFSLSENKVIERIPLDDYNNIALEMIGCAGDKFILSGAAYPNGTSVMDNMDVLGPSEKFGEVNEGYWELWEQIEYVIFTLDRNTKELKEVFRTKHSETKGYEYYGEWFYYVKDDANDTLYKKNLLTGEQAEVTIPSGYRFNGILADKMELQRITPDWSDEKKYFTDLDGTNLTSSDLDSTVKGALFELVICAIAGDTMVVIYEIEKFPSLTSPGAYTTGATKFGLLKLDDYFNGRNNIEKVDSLYLPDKGV